MIDAFILFLLTYYLLFCRKYKKYDNFCDTLNNAFFKMDLESRFSFKRHREFWQEL